MALESPESSQEEDQPSIAGSHLDNPEDDIPFNTFGSQESGSGSDFFEDEEEESESEFSEDRPEGNQEKDRLLHWWCQRQLTRSLQKLSRMDHAVAFLEPMPWKELELDDYLEIVEQPMDLKTVGEKLELSLFDDEDGLVDPEQFWADIALCWDNTLKYYNDDMELEACVMAKTMAEASEKLEDEFWVDLETFEQNLETVDPTLGGVAAAMDVAAGTMEDAAASAYDSVSAWLRSLNNAEAEKVPAVKKDKEFCIQPIPFIQNYEVEYDPDALPTPMDYQFYRSPPPPLQEHFGDLLLIRYRHTATKDMRDIEAKVDSAIRESSKLIDERDGDAEFDGFRQKIPLTRLFPGLKVSRAKKKASPNVRRSKSTAGSEAGERLPSPKRRAKNKLTENGDKISRGDSVGDSVGSARSSTSSKASSKVWKRGRRKSSEQQVAERRLSGASASSISRGASASSISRLSAGGSALAKKISDVNLRMKGSGLSKQLGMGKQLSEKLERIGSDPRVQKALSMAGDKDDDVDQHAETPKFDVTKLKNIIGKRQKPTD